ncbi:MAG: GerMN domain-containing protein [Terriglobales bacterium]|jgi:hypothetical protein
MIPKPLVFAITVLLASVLGLGVYLRHLAHKAKQAPSGAADTRPVMPPSAGPETPAILYLANDDQGTLRREETTVAMPADAPKRAREILRTLVLRYQEQGSAHPLGAGADIDEVYLVGANLAVVDVNGNFADHHRSGILVEDLTLASMARTLAANLPGITSMKLLVDGRERATLAGHADLLEPFSVSAAERLVK